MSHGHIIIPHNWPSVSAEMLLIGKEKYLKNLVEICSFIGFIS